MAVAHGPLGGRELRTRPAAESCGGGARSARGHAPLRCVEIGRDADGQDEATGADTGGTEVCGRGQAATKVLVDGPQMPLAGWPDIAAQVERVPIRGFNTPSRKLEPYSETIAGWGLARERYPELPSPMVHHSLIDDVCGEYVLLRTYGPPTLSRSRSGNARCLNDPLVADLSAGRRTDRGRDLPDDDEIGAPRADALCERPSALELHRAVEGDPVDVWGPLPARAATQQAAELQPSLA